MTIAAFTVAWIAASALVVMAIRNATREDLAADVAARVAAPRRQQRLPAGRSCDRAGEHFVRSSSRMNQNPIAALAALSSLFADYGYSRPQIRGTSHLTDPRTWPRKFGGRKAGREPRPQTRGAREEFLRGYAGRTWRHRITGDVRSAHEASSGTRVFLARENDSRTDGPRGFYFRSYRSAMKWLRNADEVVA